MYIFRREKIRKSEHLVKTIVSMKLDSDLDIGLSLSTQIQGFSKHLYRPNGTLFIINTRIIEYYHVNHQNEDY